MYMQGQENMYGGLRVTSACHMGEVKLIDSKVKSTLPSSLKELACIYAWRVLDQRRNFGEQNPLPTAGGCTRL